MNTLVMKIGGNVLFGKSGIQEALQIIAAQKAIWEQLVVVTSAISGVTDALQDIVQTAANNKRSAFRADVADVREIHLEAAHSAISNPRQLETLLRELDTLFFKLLEDCEIIHQKQQADPMLADRVMAMGEMLITRIVAAAGRAQGLKCVALDASRLIITDDRHTNARPITTISQQFIAQNLLPLLEQQIIPIVTGYIGASEKGAITTLGRGGSDYSATYLASLLNATEVWFFSDVDGLMSADPAVVSDARVLQTISYQEVAELARFGARVMHPRAIEPLVSSSIPLRIRPLADPTTVGTFICDYPTPQSSGIHAVTQALGLRVRGASQSNMTEACNHLLSQYLNDDLQPALQIDVNAGNTIIYVAPTSANQEAFYNCIDHLKSYDNGDEWEADKVTVIAVIGSLTLQHHIEILRALAKAKITPEAFGQGQTGVFLLVVAPDDSVKALNSIHALIKQGA